jgi:hypothetical protein
MRTSRMVMKTWTTTSTSSLHKFVSNVLGAIWPVHLAYLSCSSSWLFMDKRANHGARGETATCLARGYEDSLNAFMVRADSPADAKVGGFMCMRAYAN